MTSFIKASQALSLGVDLWLISNHPQSLWRPQIDWRLNFKMTKNLKYPFLIESSQNLPCRWVVEIPFQPDWINTSLKVWKELNQPSVRFFIPQSQPLTAQNEFKALSLVQYVLDLKKEDTM